MNSDIALNDYLTDGMSLFRFLGEIVDGAEPMVGLENCRSLDVILVPAEDFQSRELRLVLREGTAQ